MKLSNKGGDDMNKMTIGLNIGHYGSEGAVGYLNELELNTRVYNALKPLLEKQGHKVIPLNVAKAPDYVSATNLANRNTLDLIISIHHNSHPNKTASGTEVLHYTSSKVGEEYAAKLSKAISDALWIPNRGAKPNKDIYIIKNTKAPCVLLECCFVSNKEDCQRWDADKIAKAVASVFGEVKTKTEYEELVETLSKHIAISDKEGLIKELEQNPNSRLYWICKKCAEKFGG